MKPITILAALFSRSVFVISLTLALLAGCGGGSGGSDEGADPATPPGCDGSCANANTFLTVQDVERIIAQAVNEAVALGTNATIAVVDRVGNVLGVFRMNNANNPGLPGSNFGLVTVTSGRTPPVTGGLEGVAVIPDSAAAIAKAITGAYLSSEGNAFTTRTANQIVQEHFNPGEINQGSGPLFGVQFSSLPCSDLNTRFSGMGADAGPKRSPLGLSADPGGLPLYKRGTPVGGIGVISDGVYGLDLNIGDIDRGNDELIAVAGTFRFAAPNNRLADRIFVDGKAFRFSDVNFPDLASIPATAPDFATGIDGVFGSLITVPGYFDPAVIIPGTVFGTPASGVAPADDILPGLFPGLDAFLLVDNNGNPRFPPIDGTDGLLTQAEVAEILRNAIFVANRTRAQIRQPASTQMRASVFVVDTNGVILGMLRTRDAPVFGLDVSLQKARTAALFSDDKAGALLRAAPNVSYINADGSAVIDTIVIADYVSAVKTFLGLPGALDDGAFAFSDRAGGNLSRPYFPDGLVGQPNGPFSKPFPLWSPFSDGLQLDLAYNQIIGHVLFLLGLAPTDVTQNCTGISDLPNGIQIFPGSVPIFKGNTLAGGIGVSGDGVDQDDMISFLGLHNAGVNIGTVNNAPIEIRADQIEVPSAGVNLRFIQCPQGPFIDSTEQEPCNGK